MSDNNRIMELLAQAKKLAREYYLLTGKPLGVTGEIAEYEASRLLRVELKQARQAGYDAIEICDGMEKRLQIKGRCLQDNCKPGQKIGSIRIEKEWDAVLMVLLNQEFEATEIYEADRKKVVEALTTPGSIARNKRGSLSVSKFKSIGKLRWPQKDVIIRVADGQDLNLGTKLEFDLASREITVFTGGSSWGGNLSFLWAFLDGEESSLSSERARQIAREAAEFQTRCGSGLSKRANALLTSLSTMAAAP